jgi:hypothetical protein
LRLLVEEDAALKEGMDMDPLGAYAPAAAGFGIMGELAFPSRLEGCEIMYEYFSARSSFGS